MSQFWRNPGFWLCAVTSVLFFLLYNAMVPFSDDYWYDIDTRGVESHWEATKITFSNCLDHLNYDTGRLANLIPAPFLSLLPRWVFACCTSALIFITLIASCRVAEVKLDSLWGFMSVFVYVVLLPWHDSIMGMIFSFNYVWTSALVIPFLAGLTAAARGHRYGKYAIIAMGVFSIPAGWMHEAFSLTTLIGLVAFYIAFRRRPSRQEWIILTGFALGTALNFAFPALWVRLGNQTSAAYFNATLIKYNFMYWIYCLLLVVALSKKRLRLGTYEGALAVLFFVAGLLSTVLFVTLHAGLRIVWYNTLLSGIGTVWMLARVFRVQVNVIVKRALMVIIAAFIVTHLAYAINIQYKLKSEYQEVYALAEEAGDGGSVYYDVMPGVLDLSLFKTSVLQFNTGWWWSRLVDYHFQYKSLTLLPTAFKHFSADKAEPLGGDLYLFENYIVSSDTTLIGNYNKWIEITTTEFGPKRSSIGIIPITNTPDSAKMYYIKPLWTVTEAHPHITGARWAD